MDVFRDPQAPARPTRCACIIVGAEPAAVAAMMAMESERVRIHANRLGTLVTGQLGGLPLDYADAFAGPVYDVMFNPATGWFSVTVFAGSAQPVRYDNRPGTNPGYPRVSDILGATTPEAILEVLDVPAELLAAASDGSS